jgi:hypothetical protein
VKTQAHRPVSRHLLAVTVLMLVLVPAGVPHAQPTDPSSDPFPIIDVNEAAKSIVTRLNFNSRFDVQVASIQVVRERTHVRISDPPLLSVQVQDLLGFSLDTFNAWHPMWAFEETATGGERRVIRPAGARGRLTFPFLPEAAKLVVTDVAAARPVATIDLLPTTHDYCRNNPSDPDCAQLANRPPTCNAGGPYVAECTAPATAVQLNGTASTDPDLDPITSYTWTGGFAGGTASGPTPVVTFPTVGSYPVTLFVTDSLGADAMCSVPALVVDTIPPTITAPADVTISVCVNANIGQPTAADGCGAPTITSNRPAKFPLGTTVVTWTATDAGGNTTSATQRVNAVLADDASCCPTGSHIIQGTGASNQILGTSGNDCILGRGGDDVIDGRGGDDAISGGEGRDTIFAGAGNDRVYGGPGDDTLNAAPGNNFIEGGSGTDGCFVDPGKDTALTCNP